MGLTFASVSNGRFYTCALTPAGAAYCWGYNGDGQLGNATRIATHVPCPSCNAFEGLPGFEPGLS
jgi:alpha-tubulin suppressor-like RCC1 family protein